MNINLSEPKYSKSKLIHCSSKSKKLLSAIINLEIAKKITVERNFFDKVGK